MIEVLLGNHPETGESWKFHVLPGGELTPFSAEEMEEGRRSAANRYMRLAAAVFNTEVTDPSEIAKEAADRIDELETDDDRAQLK